MLIIKRDGSTAEFNETKIEMAILKAMKYGSGIIKRDVARDIAGKSKLHFATGTVPTVKIVEDYVYDSLIEHGENSTAKAYEGYRSIQSFKREINTTDDSILGLIRTTNNEVMNENSNKNARLASTQRDLIAGEVSKDIAKRKLIPARIIQAHNDGVLHYHDLDYAMQPIFNCCLVNLKDMLDNGTAINGKMIETPKSFQTACTITTQIIAQVASGQYGGQSINGIDRILAPYVRKSYLKYLKSAKEEVEMIAQATSKTEFYNEKDSSEERKAMLEAMTHSIAWDRTKKEVKAGVQTIQYQINTLQTSNGQSPFVTLLMHFEPGYEYEKEAALIIQEILEQRIQGIKNEKGVYITPTFPKLIYVLDEHNVPKDSKYRYLTDLAVRCSSKRMYPDYISAKKMKEIYEGNVFSPMGCRAFLSPWKNEAGEYVFDSRFNMGVVSLNLPQVGIVAEGNEEAFWNILDERLALCKEALMTRYELLKGTTSDISPIHWQHGALARLEKGQTIDHLLTGGFATITLGYIGLYEVTKLMTGKSHTQEKEFALRVMRKLKETVDRWREEENLGFALYGTPAESLTHRFCSIDKARYGEIEDVTDKGFYINSYHVDTRENIDAFSKLKFESEFQEISTGGCISYVEIPNMFKNMEALEQLIDFMYDNISYAEINTKSDYCHVCNFDGEILVDENLEWYCPNCDNRDKSKMDVVRRTCGYLGANFWNEGRTKDIKSRVLHL